MLLTRDEFRENVFKRDNFKCVSCFQPAQDAHHILERRLWDDGGYYLDNGASLCGSCHIKAESTELSCEFLRERCGIKNVLLPEHFYRDQEYDKWGNIILSPIRRIPGELYFDDSVRSVLSKNRDIRNLSITFENHFKYPRTLHLPWSPGIGKDDRVMKKYLYDGEIIFSEKMDGENTTMYNDYIHARSITSGKHVSRDWVKALWSQIHFEIPVGMRICGENLFAKHSIHYQDLKSYFLVFSIWMWDTCLSWKETLEWCDLLNLDHVMYGKFESINDIPNLDSTYLREHEGYVVRPSDSFKMKDFRKYVGKYVRKNHVTTENHWIHSGVTKNKLLGES